jgi:hypothetical protein
MQARWRPKPLAIMSMPDHGRAAAEMKSFRGKREFLQANIGAVLSCQPAGSCTQRLNIEIGARNLPRFYRLYIGKESALDQLTICPG